MELTQEEKTYLIKLLSQLTFNVESLDQGFMIKGIIQKLSTKEVKSAKLS